MNVFITLDYELFLGEPTGTPENCLVRPIKELIKILNRTNTKLTVFVDGAYLVRMEQLMNNEPKLAQDYETVINNLKLVRDNGHCIQYHFHPQWLYSEFNQEWNIDLEHYKLSDVPMDTLSQAFKRGIDIIEGVTGKKVTAFRAGGYSLCSYDLYGYLFKENGIVLDSSVKRGSHINSRFQSFDYRNAPVKSTYFFKEDVCKESNNKDAFIELSIATTKKISSITYLIRKRRLLSMFHPKLEYADGKSVTLMLSKSQRYFGLINKFFGSFTDSACLDSFSSFAMKDAYDYCKSQGRKDFVIVGHSKRASDVSLAELEKFINYVLKNGDKFSTTDDVVNELKIG